MSLPAAEDPRMTPRSGGVGTPGRFCQQPGDSLAHDSFLSPLHRGVTIGHPPC